MKQSRNSERTEHTLEDLSILERRGELSKPERRRFQMALTASPLLQCSHQLGKDFDALSTDCPNDATLVNDLVIAAAKRYGKAQGSRPGPRRRRVLTYVMLASLFPLSAAAGAALWPYAYSYVVDTKPSPSITVVRAAPVTGRPQRNREMTVPATSEPQKQIPSVQTVATHTNPQTLPTAKEESTLELTSAKALFSAANQARRQGDLTTAKAYFQQLAERFPADEHTVLSYLLLGRIYLQNGSAMAARIQFEEYLRLAPTGALAQEALQGRAEAYRQLGMQTQEAEALQTLLRSFPDSLYRHTAEVRLRELQQ